MLLDIELLTEGELMGKVMVIHTTPEAHHKTMNEINAWQHRRPDLEGKANFMVLVGQPTQVKTVEEVVAEFVPQIALENSAAAEALASTKVDVTKEGISLPNGYFMGFDPAVERRPAANEAEQRAQDGADAMALHLAMREETGMRPEGFTEGGVVNGTGTPGVQISPETVFNPQAQEVLKKMAKKGKE